MHASSAVVQPETGSTNEEAAVPELVAVDTSVLIDQERGVVAASNCVSSLLHANVAALHPVSRADMMIGARDRRHLAQMQSALNAFRELPVRNEDFRRAITLLEASVLTDRVEWTDCLIAATCLRLRIPIVTVNDRDFRVVQGLKVIRPY